MAHDVFISHSSKDKQAADAICNALEKNGIRCWLAPRDVRPGFEYAEELIHGIKDCKVFLLIFSKESNTSKPVSKEIESAFRYEKTVIPFRIEDVEMRASLEYYLSNLHWLDAFPDDNEFDALVKVVKSTINVVSPAAVHEPAPVAPVSDAQCAPLQPAPVAPPPAPVQQVQQNAQPVYIQPAQPAAAVKKSNKNTIIAVAALAALAIAAVITFVLILGGNEPDAPVSRSNSGSSDRPAANQPVQNLANTTWAFTQTDDWITYIYELAFDNNGKYYLFIYEDDWRYVLYEWGALDYVVFEGSYRAEGDVLYLDVEREIYIEYEEEAEDGYDVWVVPEDYEFEFMISGDRIIFDDGWDVLDFTKNTVSGMWRFGQDPYAFRDTRIR
jgi:hypothetical protein